jgi:hypothetical protein
MDDCSNYAALLLTMADEQKQRVALSRKVGGEASGTRARQMRVCRSSSHTTALRGKAFAWLCGGEGRRGESGGEMSKHGMHLHLYTGDM